MNKMIFINAKFTGIKALIQMSMDTYPEPRYLVEHEKQFYWSAYQDHISKDQSGHSSREEALLFANQWKERTTKKGMLKSFEMEGL